MAMASMRSVMATPFGKFSRILPEKLTEKLGSVQGKVHIAFPERFKGTVVEKWANYWQNLLNDYREVGKETVKDIRTRPVKSAFIACGIGSIYYCGAKNPNETSFRDSMLSMSNEMTLVPKTILNPQAANHLTFLETCYNEGIVRRLNIGVASVMWIDNYDKALGLFASQCSYLKPNYLKFHERIIDIGFLGRWWFMDKIMCDFDINPAEWSEAQDGR